MDYISIGMLMDARLRHKHRHHCRGRVGIGPICRKKPKKKEIKRNSNHISRKKNNTELFECCLPQVNFLVLPAKYPAQISSV